MLEHSMKSIKKIIKSLLDFFAEDKYLKQQNYLYKLETTLNLTIKFYHKYSNQNVHKYSYFDRVLDETVEIIINLYSEQKWQLKIKQDIKTFNTTTELAEYYWTHKMDIVILITRIFDNINTILYRKNQAVIKEKKKYNEEISCLDEAIPNLEVLTNIDISEDVKNK